jgi:hypothetical protein
LTLLRIAVNVFWTSDFSSVAANSLMGFEGAVIFAFFKIEPRRAKVCPPGRIETFYAIISLLGV